MCTVDHESIFFIPVCVFLCIVYNWSQTQIKMRFLGSTGKVKVRPLSEEVAVDLGAQLIGEGTIFLVAAGTLTAEYTRSSIASDKKEAAKAEELLLLHNRIDELGLTLEQQSAELRELRRYQGTLHTALAKKGMKGLPSLDEQPKA